MKRLAFLVAGSAVILVAGASPALADNGPHVKTSIAAGGSGTISNVTKCASCHRAHTAPAAMLLVEDQQALCYTCHSGTGAQTNVKDGVDANTGSGLRGGGFTNSVLDSGNASVSYTSSGRLQNVVIPALGTPTAVTSSHGMGESAAWGLGLSGGATGNLSTPLECGSCHDPHGNGNYRILTPVPGGVTNATIAVTSAVVASNKLTVTTASEHYLGVGSQVTLAGFAAPDTAVNATYAVESTASYTTFVVALTHADGSLTTTGVTAKNAGSTIADATTKTYTTANYWLVNDQATPTTTIGTTANVASFIGNIAQWCTQCHTRYLTGRSGSYANPTSDPIYTYRHRSNAVRANGYTPSGGTALPTNGVNAANCIQCHVSHGSNAVMTGAAAQVNYPGTTGAGNYENSALLRMNGRGVCQACHNK